jgi:enoyl-CoA hydratase/carnithine racemase
MTFSTLELAVEDGIATLSLAGPHPLNTFTVTTGHDLIAAFDALDKDNAVRAVIVTGRGQKAFCAGMDLGTVGNVFGIDETREPHLSHPYQEIAESEHLEAIRDLGGRVSLAISNCRKPVIGAINGLAIGVGATMTLAMDARIASEPARFGFVFGKIGIVPEACSTWFLPRIVGLPQAMDWLLSAEIFDAQEALRGRLVREVTAPDALLVSARQLADRFTQNKSRVSTALTKQMLIRNALARTPMEAHKIESLAMFYTSMGDGAEGVRAFIEKRAPNFDDQRPMPPFYPWWE